MSGQLHGRIMCATDPTSKTCQYAGFVRLDVFAGTVPCKDCLYFFFLFPFFLYHFDHWIIHAMSSFERVCDLHASSFSIFKRTEQ